jgi:hypothetical protein
MPRASAEAMRRTSPVEEAPSKFWTLVNWGSYARLVDYEEDRKMLVLRSPGPMS